MLRTLVALVLAVGVLWGAPARGQDPCAGGRPALLEAGALRLLPPDTLFVMGLGDPLGVMDDLGRERVVARFPQEYGELSAGVREATGHDLLDPGQWPRIGIDPHGPMGFAWLDLGDETFAFFVTLTDAAALEAFLTQMSAKDGHPLSAETVGDARILHPPRDPELQLVLRSGQAVLVISDEGGPEAIAAARRVALQDADESLAAQDGFRGAMDALAFGAAGALWLDARRLLETLLAAEEAAPVRWEQQEYDRGRNEGLPADILAALREQLSEERRWRDEYEQRRLGQRALLDALVASAGSLTLGVELDARALRLRSVADLPRTSLLGRLVRPGDGVPLLVRALGDVPVYLGTARFDMDAVLDAIELLVAADGGDMAEVRRDFREELGLDFDQDLVAAFDGELGIAFTGGFGAASDPVAFFQALGGALVLGVRDEGKARALVERLVAEPDLAQLVARTPDGGWRIDVPFWRPLHLALAGGALILTTDEGFVGRARSGAAGPWFAASAGSPVGALLRDDRAAAVYVADLSVMKLWVGSLRAGMVAGATAPLPEPAPGAAEPSAKERQIRRTMAELDSAIQERSESMERARTAAMERLIGLIGTTVFVGRVEGDRLASCGAQFVGADSLAGFGEGLVSSIVALARSDEEESALWELRERRWGLERALEEERADQERRRQEQKSRTGD